MSNKSVAATSQYFDECVPPELLGVDLRKKRAKRPNQRPPSIDFLKRSKETTTEEIEVEIRPTTGRRLSFNKTEDQLERTPSERRVETMMSKKNSGEVPAWLLELKKRKAKHSDSTKTKEVPTTKPAEVLVMKITQESESEEKSREVDPGSPIPPENSAEKEVAKHIPESKPDIEDESHKENKQQAPSRCVTEARSDLSETKTVPAITFSKNSQNKKPDIRPTLSDLKKGAEKINNSIAELQRDMQILLQQIKLMQTTDSAMEE